MESSEKFEREQRYARAKERVEKIKSFYKHAAFYLVINVLFIAYRIYKDISHGDSFVEAFTDTGNYRIFYWWGLILVFHAIGTFGFLNLFSKDWEERKIKEFMQNQDR